MNNDTVTIDVHQPTGVRAGQYLIIGDAAMVVPGPPRIVKKGWVERIRSLKPWVSIRYEPTMVPSEHCVVIDKKIFCHPDVAKKLIDVANKEKK